MAGVKLEPQTPSCEPNIKEEPESPFSIKEEPEEFPFPILTVKTEDDQDKACVLHQREEIKVEQSDTDCSDDYSQENAPKNKRSFTMISPDAKPEDRPFSCLECGKTFQVTADLNKHVFAVHRRESFHKCSVCEEAFSLKSLLNKHMKVHTGDKPFVRSVCLKGFDRKSCLSKHQRNVHHICPVCFDSFTSKKGLNKHLHLHVEQGTLDSSSAFVRETVKCFSCSECEARFRSKRDLLRHRSSVHRGQRLKCSTQTSCLNEHVKPHTLKKAFVCAVCDKAFSFKCRLIRHMNGHARKKRVPCSVCQESFTRKVDLNEHMKTHHTEEKTFSCFVCREGFPLKALLNKHMKVHSGEKRFVCSVCDRGFVKKSDLSRHQKRVHHMCPVCSGRFSDKETLTEHLQGHVEEGTLGSSSFLLRDTVRSFSCPECEMSCVLKADLSRHQRLVHHICPICSDRLSDRASFNEHLQGHVEEGTLNPSSALYQETVRSFCCTECGKSFKKRTTLDIHMSVHTGNKPHTCPVCQKGFSQKGNLSTHMKTHTSGKPFVCSVCDKGFSQSGYLKKHMKIHT